MIMKFEKFSWNFRKKKPNITEPVVDLVRLTYAFVGEQVKEFSTWTKPEKPYKRYLTDYENDILKKYFRENFSWSSRVDKNGYIFLGGGDEGNGGRYYITEDFFNELDSFIKDPEFYMDAKKYNL